MKGIARSFVYQPRIDRDMENVAKTCELCGKHANRPPKCSDHYWEYPKSSWERTHIDFAGPFEGAMLLIVTDAYSKLLDVKVTKSITCPITRQLSFRQNSSNTSHLLASNTTSNQRRITPKRTIKQKKIKRALKAMGTTHNTLKRYVNEFLQQHRNAPHSTTGEKPAKIFLVDTRKDRSL
nr:uncharacterized protein K02A2.6-like isoform X2 [Drosophila virilis]